MIEMLSAVKNEMNRIGINYAFGMIDKPVYPYWIGSYTESPVTTEDGKEEYYFILTGFSRGKYIELENQKSIIKEHFKHGLSILTEDKTAVNFLFGGCQNIPLDEPDLKKCEITLNIKVWKGR